MEDSNDLIEIRVEFERGRGDPARVFRAMTGLIEATQRLDEHLSATISTAVQTTLVLQDVETTSLKAKLRTVIQELPDEALKEGNAKMIIGYFLLKAKHRVLDWCSERNEIRSRDEVKQLEADIHRLAEQSDVKLLPAYAPVETGTLLSDIKSIRGALENLSANDNATFTTPEGVSAYNPKLVISEQVVRELVTRETLDSASVRIIKVKKPDYLGSSMWSFKYAGHLIEAKILDENWLVQFQSRKVELQPGDSLRVVLREKIAYGYDNEIVHVEYEVVEVREVIQAPKFIQGDLLDRE